MRFEPGELSENIEDRRGQSAGGGGFGFGRAPMGIGGAVILAVLSLIFGQNFFTDDGSAPATTTREAGSRTAGEENSAQVVSFTLDDAQETWQKVFAASGRTYRPAKLVLFRDAVNSGCGFAQAATGPFYCPADEKVYIDLGFFEELDQRFGASGDFAQAYVVAHEIGHHVQHILGIDRQVRQLQQRNPGAENPLSVKMELQADCFAGIWGQSTARRDHLEPGDVEEALSAAAAIGDDRLQRMGRGRVAPESFTHGSSAQRVEWFRRGMENGKVGACDTFEGR